MMHRFLQISSCCDCALGVAPVKFDLSTVLKNLGLVITKPWHLAATQPRRFCDLYSWHILTLRDIEIAAVSTLFGMGDCSSLFSALICSKNLARADRYICGIHSCQLRAFQAAHSFPARSSMMYIDSVGKTCSLLPRTTNRSLYRPY